MNRELLNEFNDLFTALWFCGKSVEATSVGI